MHPIRRFAVAAVAASLAFLPMCTPNLGTLVGTAVTAALTSLAGCLSPGSLSPQQIAPAQSQGSPSAAGGSANATNTATASPSTVLNMTAPPPAIATSQPGS